MKNVDTLPRLTQAERQERLALIQADRERVFSQCPLRRHTSDCYHEQDARGCVRAASRHIAANQVAQPDAHSAEPTVTHAHANNLPQPDEKQDKSASDSEAKSSTSLWLVVVRRGGSEITTTHYGPMPLGLAERVAAAHNRRPVTLAEILPLTPLPMTDDERHETFDLFVGIYP